MRAVGKILIIALLVCACSPDEDRGPVFHGVIWADSNVDGLFTFGEDPCPAGWGLPTVAEFETLLDLATVSRSRSADGVRFTDIASNASIVLPLAGYRLAGSDKVNGEGSYGCYWSNDPGDNGNGVCLTLFVFPGSNKAPAKLTVVFPDTPAEANVAQSVRCVKR